MHSKLVRVRFTKNVKNTLLWAYFVSDLDEEEIAGTFFEKELQKNQT